jgi:hypothetical protein
LLYVYVTDGVLSEYEWVSGRPWASNVEYSVSLQLGLMTGLQLPGLPAGPVTAIGFPLASKYVVASIWAPK